MCKEGVGPGPIPRMTDPPTHLPPPQGGRPTTNDQSPTQANYSGTPTSDRHRQNVDIPPENARYVNFRCVNPEQSLKSVSPFIIKKVLDGQVVGNLEYAKKSRDGSLLVKVLLSSQV